MLGLSDFADLSAKRRDVLIVVANEAHNSELPDVQTVVGQLEELQAESTYEYVYLLLHELVEEGWILERDHEEDGRKSVFQLSGDAREILGERARIMGQFDELEDQDVDEQQADNLETIDEEDVDERDNEQPGEENSSGNEERAEILGIPDLSIGDVLEVSFDSPRSDQSRTRTGEVKQIRDAPTESFGPTGETEVILESEDGGKIKIWPVWESLRTEKIRQVDIVEVERIPSSSTNSPTSTEGNAA